MLGEDDPNDADETSGFNEITRKYKADPTIENYVALRKSNPNEVIEIATTGGLDFLISQNRLLLDNGIEPKLFAGALDANEEDQSKLSLILLEKIIERKKLEDKGNSQIVSRGKAVSDLFLNFMIGCMLDALDWNQELYICRDLIVLIKAQLAVVHSEHVAHQKKLEKMNAALFIAAQLVDAGITPTFRRVAEIMKVQPSTVKRWFPKNGELIAEANRLKGISSLLEDIRDLKTRHR